MILAFVFSLSNKKSLMKDKSIFVKYMTAYNANRNK